jgi:hypothetical protein
VAAPETVAMVDQIPNLLDHQGMEGLYSSNDLVESSPSRKNQFKVISATAIPTTIEIPSSQKLEPPSDITDGLSSRRNADEGLKIRDG